MLSVYLQAIRNPRSFFLPSLGKYFHTRLYHGQSRNEPPIISRMTAIATLNLMPTIANAKSPIIIGENIGRHTWVRQDRALSTRID